MTWCADVGVCDVVYGDANIGSEEAFSEWTEKLEAGFAAVMRTVGRKFPLMVCIDGLAIQKEYSARYSKLAVDVAHRYASMITRYGTRSMTGRVVAVEAMRRALNEPDPTARAQEYAANIFESRDEAIKFVHMLREQAGDAAAV